MRILAVDPGKNPGYCFGVMPGSIHVVTHDLDPAGLEFDEMVIEDQHLSNFIYRNGRRQPVSKRSQLTLVRTAERILMSFKAERKYRILPDVWRRVLWPGAGRLNKTVVLARLGAEYNTLVEHVPKKNRPDTLESIGIWKAWSRLPQEQKEKYRVE